MYTLVEGREDRQATRVHVKDFYFEKVTEVGDTHLLNLALAGFGISAAAAIVLALAIIGIAALSLRNKAAIGTASAHLAAAPAAEVTQPAASARVRQAA